MFSFAYSLKSSEVMTGTSADVTKVARQILNRSIAHRTIPKQECMVELANLPLVLCSETFETVNLSGSYRLTSSTHHDLVSQYRKLSAANPTVSLHRFVTESLNKRTTPFAVIPHYVGARGQPRFPVTKEYAMSILLVHKPWAAPSPPLLDDAEWINLFNVFVNSDECPTAVKLEYARIKDRYETKQPDETVATEECYDNEVNASMDDVTRDILGIVTNNSRTSDPFLTVNDHQFDRGLQYDWTERHIVSRLQQMKIDVTQL